MKTFCGSLRSSWLYSLTIILVVFSLLFSPLAGLGYRALAGGNESAAVQIETGPEDLGNITNPEPVTSPALQPSEVLLGNDSIVPQITPAPTPTEEPAPTPTETPTPENQGGTTPIISSVPPVISGVQVTKITTTWATIVWTTDSPADTVVNYGTSTGLGLTITDAGLTTNHSILLVDLSRV